MTALIYTGIGSRDTPGHVLTFMSHFAEVLATNGWTLRSGGAQGADSAFELGCRKAKGAMQIFLPWTKFNGHIANGDNCVVPQFNQDVIDIARAHHPNWANLTTGVRKLIARNVCQVLGTCPSFDTPSRFVICWTPGGKSGGGTGTAIRVARTYGVPVYDLGEYNNLDAVWSRIEGV